MGNFTTAKRVSNGRGRKRRARGGLGVFVRVTAIVSPIWFVFSFGFSLKIFLNDAVWAGFSVIEMGEWSVIV